MENDQFMKSFEKYYGKSEEILQFENKIMDLANFKETSDLVSKIQDIISLYLEMDRMTPAWLPCRNLFTRNISWAIASQEAVETITKWIVDYQNSYGKNCRCIDLGAGSGVWELLLHGAGLSSDSLIAIDLPKQKKTHRFVKTFWEIQEIENYEVNVNDILFIAWGCGQQAALESYVKRGGKCVIILGEAEGGCTDPHADYFFGNDEWDVKIEHVAAGFSLCSDLLTLNLRK